MMKAIRNNRKFFKEQYKIALRNRWDNVPISLKTQYDMSEGKKIIVARNGRSVIRANDEKAYVWLLRSLKSPAVAERSSTSSAQSAVAFSLAFHSRADDRVSGVAPPASTPGDYEFLVSSFNCGAGTEKQRRTRTNVDEIILSGKLHVC